MKSYTDIEQSKKLAKILPLESADYCWGIDYESRYMDFNSFPYTEPYNTYNNNEDFIPCWSLSALLDSLKIFTTPTAFSVKVCVPLLRKTNNDYSLTYTGDYTLMDKNNLDTESPIEVVADNPIDACYEMILKLNKLKML